MGTKEYHKEYYKNNKEKWDTYNELDKHKQLAREYYHRHKDKINKKKQLWDESNFEWNLWSQTKRSAKRRNLDWDLELSDIIIPEKCPIMDIPLTKIRGQGIVWTNPSVDRIDNSKGYVKTNIQIISRMANSMKQHATKEELIAFAKGILKVYCNES